MLLSSTEGWSLPRCADTAAKSIQETRGWDNCFGRLHIEKGKFKGWTYIGEFKNDKFNGQGTGTFPNGSKYVGEHKNGKPNGQGTYTFASGNKYVGEFNDGNFNGHGTMTYANGNKYVGEWKNGKYHGQGTFTFPSGEKHVGKWKNQLPNGQGVHTYTDGRIEEGIFEKGKFLYAKKPSPTITDKKSPLEKAKEQCAEIGFKKGTEKFGDCVMKLLN